MMKTPFLRNAVALPCLLIVSSCTVVVAEPPTVRPPPQQFCPRVYDPVCGRSGPDRQTFGNACEADAAGYRIVHAGQCRRGGPRPGREPRICTQQYEPVCAGRGGHVRTFGNACEARNADHRILYDAPCR